MSAPPTVLFDSLVSRARVSQPAASFGPRDEAGIFTIFRNKARQWQGDARIRYACSKSSFRVWWFRLCVYVRWEHKLAVSSRCPQSKLGRLDEDVQSRKCKGDTGKKAISAAPR